MSDMGLGRKYYQLMLYGCFAEKQKFTAQPSNIFCWL